MPDDRVLSPEWQVWIAGEVLADTPVDEIVAALVSRGVTSGEAASWVEATRVHPVTTAARQALSGPRQLARLHQQMRRSAAPVIERRSGLDAATLRDVYAAHGVPVVMPGWCAPWPAARWTPEGLAERVGDAVVQVSEGAAADRDRHWKRHSRSMRFADVVADVLASPDDGLRYLIAQHRNLDGPLASLLTDLTPDPEVVQTDRLKGNVSLWFGPGGTHTPTHHDASGILLCVLYGAKRLWLAPPDALGLFTGGGGYYATTQLSDPAVTAPGGPLEGEHVYEVVLQAGDTLYLPPCWWHEVRAEQVCLHVSMVGLQWKNRYDQVRLGS